MKVCLRRKQQHRARWHIANGLDRHIGHGASVCFASCLHLSQECHPESGDVDGCTVVSVGIVGTVSTHQPAAALHGVLSMMDTGSAVGVSGLPTARAGMAGATGLFRAETDTREMAFVAQNMPDLGADRGVIAPLAPLAPNATASPGGFQGGEGFATDEGTPPHRGEEQ